MDDKSKTGRPASCTCDVCKKCERRIYMKRWYEKKSIEERRAHIARRNPEIVRINDAKRYQRDKRKRIALANKFKAAHPDLVSQYKATWKARNAIAASCHTKVKSAIKSGKLIRPSTCDICGNGGRIEAHHDDYGKPFDVRWLCVPCHGATRLKWLKDSQ